MVEWGQLRLRQIQPEDDVTKFSLGHESYTPLKIFLRKSALDFHRYQIAKTYVLVNPDDSPSRVWGYLTLMNSEILLNKEQRPRETERTAAYRGFPAVKIARLAVDKSLQGQGVGAMLLDWCTDYVRELIMPFVGCRFLMVDAKQDSVRFYKKAGFVMLETSAIDEYPQMFFDLYKEEGELPQGTVDAIGF